VSPRGETAVIVSGSHDYRSPSRATLHPVAEALAEFGFGVSFLSIGYSPVSWLQRDRRCALWRRANRVELVGAVRCYIWRTLFHPVNPDVRALMRPARAMYRLYSHYPDQFIDEALRGAAVIIIESGLGILLLRRARALNPAARIVYLASDELATIGAHPVLQSELEACVPLLDRVCISSRRMAERFAFAEGKLCIAVHGINPEDFAGETASPYVGGCNAVAVGSMLFDKDFFLQAASEFPDVVFHVIGSGSRDRFPPNVRLYGEMPFAATIPYLKNATIGIAAYRPAAGCEYLADTSMKLMQYDVVGIPAVCPHFAVGDNPNRLGYAPGDPASIRAAVAAALARGRHQPIRRNEVGGYETGRYENWREVTLRIVGLNAAPAGRADPPVIEPMSLAPH
jgi:2-beta-glucuronyltransferase